ncbi:MAG: acyltransferase [Rubrivivax sp.]|nr:MAG: acyltransferase [Rubrivivax sp.]
MGFALHRWTPAAGPRDPAIEAARALLMLYVIGYLHLGSYVGDGETHVGWASVGITQLVLGSFTFISGYLLAAKPLRFDRAEVTRFYLRRFIRIYPLFLVALTGFVALGLTDWHTAARSALGLTMFWPWSPATLWYVVMLLVCYAVAPLLLAGTKRTALAASLTLLAFMAAWHQLVMRMDLRMATQFAAFASGVLVARMGSRQLRVSPAIGSAAIAAIALQFFTTGDPVGESAWTAIPAVCLCPLLLLRWMDTWPAACTQNRVIHFLSHAGLCAYLFHRIAFTFLERWAPQGELMHWLWLLAVSLPVILVASSLIQTAYDQLLLVRHAEPKSP